MANDKPGMKTVELRLAHRLMLLQLLPDRGNLIMLRVAAALEKRLALSEEELTALNVVQKSDQIVWDASKDTPKEFTFSPVEAGVIVDALKAKERGQQLEKQMLPVWEMFIGV